MSAGLHVCQLPPTPTPQFTASLLPDLVPSVAGLDDIQEMSETPEPTNQPTPAAAAPPPPPPLPPPVALQVKPSRLYTAAAWVVIVAGIVFILAVVFFSGAVIAGSHHPCHYRHDHGIFKPWGPPGPGVGPGQYWAPGGPGIAPPFFGGPVGPVFGPGGPGQLPTTTPSSTSPARP